MEYRQLASELKNIMINNTIKDYEPLSFRNLSKPYGSMTKFLDTLEQSTLELNRFRDKLDEEFSNAKEHVKEVVIDYFATMCKILIANSKVLLIVIALKYMFKNNLRKRNTDKVNNINRNYKTYKEAFTRKHNTYKEAFA